MSREQLEEVRCDRCAAHETMAADDHRKRSNWAIISARRLSGEPLIGDIDTPTDLCATCARELMEWFNDPAARLNIQEREAAE